MGGYKEVIGRQREREVLEDFYLIAPKTQSFRDEMNGAKISIALGLSPTALPSTWQFIPKKGSDERGAQIDLLFDRDDQAITLCEMKYTSGPFVIDKEYAGKLQSKLEVFKKRVKTDKQLFLAMVSANGIKKTMYSEELIDQTVTLKDLFQ